MSYALTLRGLGATVSANASASASGSVSSECSAAGDAFTKAATYVGLTSGAVKKVVSQCCEAFKKSSGNTESRTKDMAECFARAAATAGAAAACVAGGITAPFAGVCGTVGAFVADRVMGYSKTQLAVGVGASIVCSVATAGTTSTACFYAGAEVVGWVSDKLSPVIEGIFSPSAAADRVRAQRRADNALYFDNVEKVHEAQENIADAWRASVNRIWDLFDGAFSPNYRALAREKLGFYDEYTSIALTMMNMGVPVTVMPQAELARHTKDTYVACEAYGKKVGTSYGNLSPLCPPGVIDAFYKAIETAKGSHDESRIAAAATKELLALTAMFFFQLPLVEAALAAKIAVVAVAVKQQEALDQATHYNRSQMATKAEGAAGVAEAAADAALKGDAAESKAAVQRAKNRYDVAVAAYNMLLDTFGARSSAGAAAGVAAACAKDVDCKRAGVAVARAKAASELAVKNAAHAASMRLLMGAGVAAGVAGIAYYFLRK